MSLEYRDHDFSLALSTLDNSTRRLALENKKWKRRGDSTSYLQVAVQENTILFDLEYPEPAEVFFLNEPGLFNNPEYFVDLGF